MDHNAGDGPQRGCWTTTLQRNRSACTLTGVTTPHLSRPEPGRDPAGAAEDRRPKRPETRRWLILAAAVVLVTVLVIAVRITPSATSPSPTTPTPAGTTVMIDIYSGRENPTLPLDADVADQVYFQFADSEAADLLKPGAPPTAQLGFRGFVITSADPTRPPMRILPNAAYLDRAGTWLKMGRPEPYALVYDALWPSLSNEVRAALPATDPPIVTVAAAVPPQVGEPGFWTLVDPRKVSARSTSVDIAVTRLHCSDGKTGEILPPVVSVGSDGVVIRADAKPEQRTMATCPENDSVKVTVNLPEPLGQRPLYDAACMGVGPALRTAVCADGAARWKP